MAGKEGQKLPGFQIPGAGHKLRYLRNHHSECRYEVLWLNHPIRSDQKILQLPEQRQLIALQNSGAGEMELTAQSEKPQFYVVIADTGAGSRVLRSFLSGRQCVRV